jgi:hypothetical protein
MLAEQSVARVWFVLRASWRHQQYEIGVGATFDFASIWKQCMPDLPPKIEI